MKPMESFEIQGPHLPPEDTFKTTDGVVTYGDGSFLFSTIDMQSVIREVSVLDSTVMSDDTEEYVSGYVSSTRGQLTWQKTTIPGRCCPVCWSSGCLKPRSLCRRSLYVLIFVLTCFCVYMYLILPEILIANRVAAADLDIRSTKITIGPESFANVAPHARFAISKSVLGLPVISYRATIHEFKTDIFFVDTRHDDNHVYDRNDHTRRVKLGSFFSSKPLTVNSAEDLDVRMTGTFKLASLDNLAIVINEFMKKPKVTIGFESCVNVYTKVYGWIPCPFFNVLISKSITFDGLDGLRPGTYHDPSLVWMYGKPGRLHVKAKAKLWNPSPVSLDLKDSFAMKVYHKVGKTVQELGRVIVEHPFLIKPEDNVWTGYVHIKSGLPSTTVFLAEYYGRQEPPSKVHLQCEADSADSELMEKVTEGLNLDVSLPKPPTVLLSVKANIFGTGQRGHKLYNVGLYVTIRNPLPQSVVLKEIIELNVAMETARLGAPPRQAVPLIKDFYQDYSKWGDGYAYTLPANEEVKLDFIFPGKDVQLLDVFNKDTFWSYMRQRMHMSRKVSVAAILMIDIDGYTQTVKYTNPAIDIDMLFSEKPTKRGQHISEPGRPPDAAGLMRSAVVELST